MDAKSKKPFSFPLLTLVHWAGQDIAQYLAFSAELETLLERGHAKLEESIGEKLNSVSKEVQEELIDSYAWDLHLSSSFFPELQRESMFVTLYSYLEHNLDTVCDEIGKEIGSRVRRKDLHGRGVIRALDYLKLVPEFDLSKISGVIAFIKGANRLRNSVVHGGAVLPNEVNDLANAFVRRESGLTGNPGESVSFSSEFLTLFGTNIQALFDEIGNEMQRFMKNHA